MVIPAFRRLTGDSQVPDQPRLLKETLSEKLKTKKNPQMEDLPRKLEAVLLPSSFQTVFHVPFRIIISSFLSVSWILPFVMLLFFKSVTHHLSTPYPKCLRQNNFRLWILFLKFEMFAYNELS